MELKFPVFLNGSTAVGREPGNALKAVNYAMFFSRNCLYQQWYADTTLPE
jgi:hypothetical protein